MSVLLPAEATKKEIVDLTSSPSASPPLVRCKGSKLPSQTNSIQNDSQNNLLGNGISNMSFSVAQQTFNISLHSHPIETLKPRWGVERSDGGGLRVKNSIHNGRSLFGSTRVDLFADGNVNVPARWELPQLQVDSYRQPSSITETKHQVLSQTLAPSERCSLASEEVQKEPMATAPIQKMTEGATKPIVIKPLESKETKRCNQVEDICRTELAKTEVTKTTGSAACIACKWGFHMCDLGKPCSECIIGWDRTGIKWNCTYDPNFVRPAGPPPDIYERNDCADTATKKQKSGSGTRSKLGTLASPTPHSQPIKTSQSKSDLPEAHWQTIRKMEYKRLKEILIYILINELNFKSVDFLTSIPDDGLGCKVNYLSVEFSFTHGYAITAPKEFKRMFETPMMRWNRKNWALVPVLLKMRLITVRRLEDPAPKKAPRFIESDWSKKMKRLKGNDGWWNQLGVQESFNYRCTGFKSATRSSTGNSGETSKNRQDQSNNITHGTKRKAEYLDSQGASKEDRSTGIIFEAPRLMSTLEPVPPVADMIQKLNTTVSPNPPAPRRKSRQSDSFHKKTCDSVCDIASVLRNRADKLTIISNTTSSERLRAKLDAELSTVKAKLRKLRSGGYLLHEENVRALDISESQRADLLARNLQACKKDISWM